MKIFIFLLLTNIDFTVTASDRIVPASLSFFPSTYYVGDIVTLRFSLETPGVEGVYYTEPIPKVDWGVIHQIIIKGKEVTVIFTPHRTGVLEFPLLSIGAFQIEGIKATVSSLLDTVDQVPQPLLGQKVVPYTNLVLLITVGMILTLPLVYLGGNRWVKPVFLQWIQRFQGRHPFNQIKLTLQFLLDELENMDPRVFYILLLDSLRQYLSHRWTPGFISCTTTELETLFETAEEKEVSALLPVFKRGDQVKFANAKIDQNLLSEDLQFVRTVVYHREKSYWERKRKAR